jgi:hypothetical protein
MGNTERHSVRVVFVVQWLETFEIVAPVVRALRTSGADVRLVVTPELDILRWTSDGSAYDDELAGKVWLWLSNEGWQPEPLITPDQESQRIREMAPDAIFLPSPYPGHRHESLAPAALTVPVHYVPYAFHIWADDDSAYRAQFYRECAAVYAENGYTRGKYVAAGVDASRVVPTGSPALDVWDQPHGRSDTPTILWCPWWSATEDGGYSTFVDSYATVLAEAERRPAMRFVLRPHPLLWGQLRKERAWSDDDERRFFEHVANLPNVTVYGGVGPGVRYPFYPGHVRQFQAAWAMVTDGISFLAEFAYTGKPLLLTQASGNAGWNEVGQRIAEVVDRSDGSAGLSDFLDRVESDIDTGTAVRRAALRQLFYRPAGGSASAIADHVLGVTSRFA